MSPENNLMQQFETFAANIKSVGPPAAQLNIVASVLDLVRQVDDAYALAAVAQLLLELPPVSWRNLSFSIADAVRSPEYQNIVMAAGVPEEQVSAVLLQAVVLLLDFLQGGAEVSEQVFAAIVASVAEVSVPQPVVAKVRAPEIVSDNLFARVAKPAPVNAQTFLALDIEPVLFRGELLTGGLGPDMRGVVLPAGGNTSPLAILETGEFLPTMDRALNVAHMPADVIATFSLSVVLALLAAARQLNTRNYLPQETFVQLSNGVLGSIVTQHTSVIPAPETMAALEQVFQRGCDAITVGCTGLLSETTARFPVPNTPLAIVIDVRFSAKGPYATSRLVDDKTDAVVMRNDTPRLFSLHGVYLFPTADYGLISLVAFHRG